MCVANVSTQTAFLREESRGFGQRKIYKRETGSVGRAADTPGETEADLYKNIGVKEKWESVSALEGLRWELGCTKTTYIGKVV